MAEPRMPQALIDWIDDRNWGRHHLEWHFVRQWDRQPLSARNWAAAQGWSRAARQEGEAGNGLEFLVMHRAMLELLRENFPSQSALLNGWTVVPTNPNSISDPMPNNGQPRIFNANMQTSLTRLTNTSFLSALASDDALGRYIETRFRPTATNPSAQSADASTGLHNYVHGRFSDSASDVDMGNPELNLGNQRFWRLHGWIDGRWSAFRAAKGLPPEDSTLRSLIDAEKLHLNMSHVHHTMASMSPRASGASAATVALSSMVPRSVSRPFDDSIQSRFFKAMGSGDPPQTIDELREMVQLAIELEWFTLPPYLTAMWSIINDPNPAGNISDILRSVAIQEMLHMAIGCNLLVALGGKPKLLDATKFPKYPDFPPGIDLSQMVSLQPLSMAAVKLFMEIEKPSHEPVTIHSMVAASMKPVPTIGDFYQLIIDGLVQLNPSLTAAGQLTTDYFPDLVVIDSLEAAKRAIGLIVEQGEGTSSSASAGAIGDELAHYYRYQQIVDGVEYVRQPDGSYKKDPSKPILFPAPADIYPMAVVPAGGYPGVPEADRFDVLYTNMIGALQSAWDSGDSEVLERSISVMYGLGGKARTVLAKPLPSGTGNYGPAFLFNQPAPITSPAPTSSAAGMEPAPMSVSAMRSFAPDLSAGDKSDVERSLCTLIDSGGVGESGATLLLTHTVTAHIQKLMVLRNTDTSLCPNQAGIGALIVDGSPVVIGDITQRGHSIQAPVSPGSRVVAIVHAIPLFNGISCIQQGELRVQLDECDFEFLTSRDMESYPLPPTPATRDWYAWNDLQPPKPNGFHIIGEVEVPNPGVELMLVARTPQGINPRILLLDLHLIQRPGIWPQIVVYKQVRFDKVNITYDSVQVFSGSEVVANVDVVSVS